MMGFVRVAVAVLSLLSVGQSAPVTNCESLIQQAEIQGRDQLLGKWIYLAESTNIAGAKIVTKMFVETVWGTITAANEMHPINVTEVHLHSGCPDCIILQSNYTIGGSTYKGLQLLSRREKVSDAEMEEYRKQVKCLDLPPPAILDTSKGFCPDKQETEITDLTDTFSNMTPEHLSILEHIINTTELQMLIKMFTSMKQ
ncbi:hypothetical protein PAMP_020984 [Pampus punctatissimus]